MAATAKGAATQSDHYERNGASCCGMVCFAVSRNIDGSIDARLAFLERHTFRVDGTPQPDLGNRRDRPLQHHICLGM